MVDLASNLGNDFRSRFSPRFGSNRTQFRDNNFRRFHQPLFKLFVSNLPSDMNHSWFRSLFQGYGKIIRVYVSFKVSNKGSKFGFVSFFSKEAALKAVKELNGMSISAGGISVCFAYPDSRPTFTEGLSHPRYRHSFKPRKFNYSDDRHGSNYSHSNFRRFHGKKVWVEKNKPAFSYQTSAEDREWLNRSIIGHLKPHLLTSDALKRVQKEVPLNSKLAMVSSSMMVITFDSLIDRDVILKDEVLWLSDVFEKTEVWSPGPDFICNEKFVRIRVEGIPLHAWNENFFMNLCNNWGELIKIEEETLVKKRLDCAHFIIKVNNHCGIPEALWVAIDSILYQLEVVKEENVYGKSINLGKACFRQHGEVGNGVESRDDGDQEKDSDRDTVVPETQFSEHLISYDRIILINNPDSDLAVDEDIQGSGNQGEIELPLNHINDRDIALVVNDSVENNHETNHNILPLQFLNSDSELVPVPITFTNSNFILAPKKSSRKLQGSSSKPPRRSSRSAKSIFKTKIANDLNGLTVANCKENKLPPIPEELASVGLQLGMVLALGIEEATTVIENSLPKPPVQSS